MKLRNELVVGDRDLLNDSREVRCERVWELESGCDCDGRSVSEDDLRPGPLFSEGRGSSMPQVIEMCY